MSNVFGKFFLIVSKTFPRFPTLEVWILIKKAILYSQSGKFGKCFTN